MNETDTTDEIPEIDEKNAPSEFASFLRGLAVRALDNFAVRIVEKSEGKQPKPIRKIAEHWTDMSLPQKERFFEQMINAAQTLAAAAPAAFMAKGVAREARQKRAAKKRTAASTTKAAPKKTAAKKSPAKKSAAKETTAKKKSPSKSTAKKPTKR